MRTLKAGDVITKSEFERLHKRVSAQGTRTGESTGTATGAYDYGGLLQKGVSQLLQGWQNYAGLP